ncbi:hypothetical protein CRYUN_Cryun23aG0070200 [Craigia yunnanensis]
MATSYPGPVGSYFMGQYYQVLQQQPDLVHQFYSDASTMIRVDGDSSESVSAMLKIHTLVTSLNFTAIEIKTINSLDSWNGGVLVMVSGSVKIKDFNGRRKFVRTFFLSPQEKGYFVLNDIFQFIDDGITYQHPASPIQENKFDAQQNVSSPVAEPPISDYILEEEAREYVNSVHVEDDPVDKYSLPEQPQQEDVEAEVVVEEAPAEETLALHHSVVNALQEPPGMALEEPLGEPPRRTYASIEQSASSVQFQASYNKIPQSTSDWDHTPETTSQQSRPAWSDVPESAAEAAVDEGLVSEEGEYTSEYKSVYDVAGVCYAFVEFEDIFAVQNAIKASPIQLAGRQIYIEECRPNSSGRGRGGGSYQPEASRGRFGSRNLGRGNNQESGDYRSRGNGFYQRGMFLYCALQQCLRASCLSDCHGSFMKLCGHGINIARRRTFVCIFLCFPEETSISCMNMAEQKRKKKQQVSIQRNSNGSKRESHTYLEETLELLVQSSLKLFLRHDVAPTLTWHIVTEFHHLLDLQGWLESNTLLLRQGLSLTVKTM